MTRWLFALALAACAPTDPTQLVVVVDGDLAPTAADAVEVEVRGLEGGPSVARAVLADGPLPRFVAIERRGGALGPIEIEARALRGEAPTGISRVVRTSFVRGATRRLDLFLSTRCETVSCEAPETCDRGACVALDVPPEQLAPWEGLESDAGRPDDGGSDDGGSDASVDGGMRDGGPCTCPSPLPSNVTSTYCEANRCLPVCAELTGDCDGRFDALNGCEQSLDTRQHCGECDKTCPPPSMTESSRDCVDGRCAVVCRDPTRFDDCNGLGVDGCEANLSNDPANCGACGNVCPSGRCVTRVCRG